MSKTGEGDAFLRGIIFILLIIADVYILSSVLSGVIILEEATRLQAIQGSFIVGIIATVVFITAVWIAFFARKVENQ